ncbi:LemA family protein [Natrialba sp. INN-245]|uniref:LemA family protein n=1 Tax=Natrialba sp. INN-245 TaxID=2690967 RepID=UPI001313B173|nr:LemA family protein [Natrialba sp. INN-245]MWV41418.1 LemA family protein [Natrialba sp. INN-245]
MVWFATVVLGFAATIAGYSGLRYVGRLETTILEASERCDRAWANVEVLLERRHDEVGALIDLAVEHVEHERDVLQELLDARERAIEAQQPAEAAAASVEIREAIDDLYAVADDVPALQSADRFDDVRDSLTTIEGRLESRREYYNEAVAAYNVRIQRFPERLVATRHGLERREPFRASATAHEGIDVRDRFGGIGGGSDASDSDGSSNVGGSSEDGGDDPPGDDGDDDPPGTGSSGDGGDERNGTAGFGAAPE